MSGSPATDVRREVNHQLVGEQIDKWTLIRPLGQGGMAVVYEAQHIWLAQKAAVKLLHPEAYCDPASLERFQREALTVSRLHHPNIVEIRDFGEDPDHSYYMVMELLHGQELAKVIPQAPLPLSWISAILKQICSALEAIHQAGVIHRDLKPSNIFLLPHELYPLVKLLDFGIAKAQFAQDEALTATNAILGTPHYLAPEQIKSKQDITPATDIYALGVMLYQMLTGELPFQGDGSFEHMMLVVQEEAPPVGAKRPEFQGTALELLLTQMLAKPPQERPSSAADVWELWSQAATEFDDPLDTPSRHPSITTSNQPRQGRPTLPTPEEVKPPILPELSTQAAQHGLETKNLRTTPPGTLAFKNDEVHQEEKSHPSSTLSITQSLQETTIPPASPGRPPSTYEAETTPHISSGRWRWLIVGVLLLVPLLGWLLVIRNSNTPPENRKAVPGEIRARASNTQPKAALPRNGHWPEATIQQEKVAQDLLTQFRQALQKGLWQQTYLLYQRVQERGSQPALLYQLSRALSGVFPEQAQVMYLRMQRQMALTPAQTQVIQRQLRAVQKQLTQRRTMWAATLQRATRLLQQKQTTQALQLLRRDNLMDRHFPHRYGQVEWARWLQQQMPKQPIEVSLLLWKHHLFQLKRLRQRASLPWLKLQYLTIPDALNEPLQQKNLLAFETIYRRYRSIIQALRKGSLRRAYQQGQRAQKEWKQLTQEGWGMHQHPIHQQLKRWTQKLTKAIPLYYKVHRLSTTGRWSAAQRNRQALLALLQQTPAFPTLQRQLRRQHQQDQRVMRIWKQAQRAYLRSQWSTARLAYKRYLKLQPKAWNRRQINKRIKACRCAISLFPWEVCRDSDYPKHFRQRR